MHSGIVFYMSVAILGHATGNLQTWGAYVLQQETSYHTSASSAILLVHSETECYHHCYRGDKPCLGANVERKPAVGPFHCELIHTIGETDGIIKKEGWVYMATVNQESLEKTSTNGGSSVQHPPVESSCKKIKAQDDSTRNGVYMLQAGSQTFQSYCDMNNGGYTLVARFSNADAKDWMHSSGAFWYTTEQYGTTDSATQNSDMLSPAFALVQGSDIKLSRSDDQTHQALMTAVGCLLGTSMRAKMTSYGNFRNGAYWSSSSRCHGSCTASFSGQYATTSGFKHATSSCTGADNILDGNNIGFWCRYGSGDGAVIMIGGGGKICDRADHGIGVTEEDNPKFGGSLGSRDFGDTTAAGSTAYSLNLWIK